jgi:hypothetical protein
MCPACMAIAAVMAAGVISVGGVTALVAKLRPTQHQAHENAVETTKRKEQ